MSTPALDGMFDAIGKRCAQIDDLCKKDHHTRHRVGYLEERVKNLDRLHDLDKRMDAIEAGAAEACSVVNLKNRVTEIESWMRILRELYTEGPAEKVTVDPGIEALGRVCWKSEPDATGIWVTRFPNGTFEANRFAHPQSLHRARQRNMIPGPDQRPEWYGPLPDYPG